MIKLSKLILEGTKENATVDFLSQLIKNTEWEGKVFIAGGAVRDEILGRDVKDIDLVITEPDGGIKFSEWAAKKIGKYSDSNPVIFPRFGTAKFNLRGIKHNGIDLSDIDLEAVMTRKEKYVPGSRKPEVEFGTLKDDAERRDFTVNSLMKDISTGKILDLTGKGIHDIKHGIVRSAIDPNHIFNEDPLRMLRAIRFATKYHWQLPKYMLKAIKANADTIKNISAERVQEELNKMLVTKKPSLAIRIMQVTGLMKHVMPEFEALLGVTQNKFHKYDAYYHSLEVLDNAPPHLLTRLSALFHDIGKAVTRTEDETGVHFHKHELYSRDIADAVMHRLKYPTDMIDAVKNAVEHHMELKGAGMEGEKVSDKALRKFQSRVGDNLSVILDLMHADNLAHKPPYDMPNQIPGIRNRIGKLNTVSNASSKINLPINGNDIVKHLGIKPGPIVGQLLDVVKDTWFENPNITADAAMKLVDDAYGQQHPHIAANLDKTIMNPETQNMIKVRSALNYDKDSPVYKAAIQYLKQQKTLQ